MRYQINSIRKNISYLNGVATFRCLMNPGFNDKSQRDKGSKVHLRKLRIVILKFSLEQGGKWCKLRQPRVLVPTTSRKYNNNIDNDYTM